MGQYVKAFEELITQVKGIDEPNLISKFYTGLKPEMQQVIKLKEPKGLRNLIAAVVKMEASTFCQVMSTGHKPEEYQKFKPQRGNGNSFPRTTQHNVQHSADEKPKQGDKNKQ